jgi:DNA-binding Lrp family transcriptional regulator
VNQSFDQTDRAIVKATAGGLPLVAEPYRAVAEELRLDPADVMERISRMLETGVIRRIGAVPNHYALGLSHNAMTVWDVADTEVSRLGAEIGALDFVTHCYHRPRHPPLWPFNLFAMVHGRSQGEIDIKIDAIASCLGAACRGHDVLVSKRILKKTGMRLAG